MRLLIAFLLVAAVGCGSVREAEVSAPEAAIAAEVAPSEVVQMVTVTSPAFEHGGRIPSRYTCDGQDVNPRLDIEGLPGATKSMVLIVDDPDAPMGTWVHWVVWNIKPGSIEENSVPGIQGINDFRRHDWGGPCPPSGSHRYFFKVYALDTELDLDEDSRKQDVEKAMKGHVIGKGELIGIYSRE